MTLVDTNILLDLATDDPRWFDWSVKAIEDAAAIGPLYINAIVYAEFSARYQSPADVDAFILRAGVEFVDIPQHAAFFAAKAFEKYRSRGGTRTGVLPDFFIGAHAQYMGAPLLTRDVARYRTYFPDVDLISPKLS